MKFLNLNNPGKDEIEMIRGDLDYMTEDQLKLAKEKCIKFRDLFDGELMHHDEILNATNFEELISAVRKHQDHLIECANDANRHIDKFLRELVAG